MNKNPAKGSQLWVHSLMGNQIDTEGTSLARARKAEIDKHRHLASVIMTAFNPIMNFIPKVKLVFLSFHFK
jgi:hypothetical protein